MTSRSHEREAAARSAHGRVPLDELPGSARLWIYGADRPLTDEEAGRLERELASFIEGWAAHGTPLPAASAVREGRFALVAADERAVHASGCSIDGLVRFLGDMGSRLGCSLLDGTRLFFRGASGKIRSCDRETFRRLADEGEIGADTPVFDLALATLDELREDRFERPLAESWHRRLVEGVSKTA